MSRKYAWVIGMITSGLLHAAIICSPGHPCARVSNWAAGQPRTVPLEAIVAGHDVNGAPLYVCRGGQEEGYNLQVGKFRADFLGCHVGLNGQEVSVGDFQILVSGWEDAIGGYIPPDAVTSAAQEFGKSLYFCRGFVQGSLQPGKIEPGFDGCYVPFGGNELHLRAYQVMVSTNPVLPLELVPGYSGDFLPWDAVRAGTDIQGQWLCVCAAEFNNGLHPGKIRVGFPGCDVSWGGSEHFVFSYSVLRLSWKSNGDVGTGTFPAGTDVDGEQLFACRVDYADSGLQPGKYKAFGGCDFGYAGSEAEEEIYRTPLAIHRPV